jgi:hypothetical protein
VSESLFLTFLNSPYEFEDRIESTPLPELVEVVRNASQVREVVVPKYSPLLYLLRIEDNVLRVVNHVIIDHSLPPCYFVVLGHGLEPLDGRARS